MNQSDFNLIADAISEATDRIMESGLSFHQETSRAIDIITDQIADHLELTNTKFNRRAFVKRIEDPDNRLDLPNTGVKL